MKNKIITLIMIAAFFLSWPEHIVERTLSFLDLPTPTWMVIIVTLLMFTYIIIHAIMHLRIKKFVVFLLISMIVAFIFEGLKTTTGLLEYGELMGTKILGIPSMLPFWFFILIYSAYSTSNIVFSYNPDNYSLKNILFLSFSDSIILTSWFTMEEPINNALNTWTWSWQGDYFGSPVIAFIFCMVTGFISCFLFREFDRKIKGESLLKDGSKLTRYLPFFSYSWLAISAMVGSYALGYPGATVAGFFASLPFILMGFNNIYNKS